MQLLGASRGFRSHAINLGRRGSLTGSVHNRYAKSFSDQVPLPTTAVGKETLEKASGSTSTRAHEPTSESGGLFGEVWWPTVSEIVFQRLAQRPSGLPEDPLAQGVMSFVEYELA